MYGKVFSSMYDGTLATRGPWQALVTFQQMIVLADKDGVVDMTAHAISRRTSIPLEIIEAGIAELSLPDPESRSAAEDGRRIVLLEGHRTWGWQIVNYAKYAALRSSEERREYMRIAQAEHRARVKAAALASTSVTTSQDKSANVKKSTDVSVDVPVDVPVPVRQGGKPPCNPLAPTALPGKQARKRASKPDTEEVWSAYAQAYEEKYGVQPVRNAKVNGQIAQLLSRLGADEAPGVARSYLSSRNGLYVSSKHCVDLLLRDCEKLRTEWVTGSVGHQRDAREEDRMSATAGMVQRITQKLEAKGAKL